jgi:gluconokinase
VPYAAPDAQLAVSQRPAEHRVNTAPITARPCRTCRLRNVVDDRAAAPILLIMGVSGSGKTTVGALLAGRLQWPYAEADNFHPPANLRKMRAGEPLTDADRLPWLEAIGAWIDEQIAAGRPAVVSCSALKRSYRDILRGPGAGRSQLRFIYLQGDRELIARRMAARHGHFFPQSLLDSQFRDLEPLGPDEHAIVVPIDGTPAEITDEILSKLGRRQTRGRR